MNTLEIPDYCKADIDGEEYFHLSQIIRWLKGDKWNSSLVNSWKRRADTLNVLKYKKRGERGKPKVYVNREGLRQIMERTPSISIDKKSLLGMHCGVTRSEIVFGSIIEGFFNYYNIKVDTQVEIKADNGLSYYSIDFVIGDAIAVEFDEMEHRSYPREKELEREGVIRSKYKLYRVGDTDNYFAFLAMLIADLCPNSGECLRKAIDKARNH